MASKIASIASSMIADIIDPKSEDSFIIDNDTKNINISSYALILKKVDKIDKYLSKEIHKLELHYFDFIIAIPGTLFGVIGCPILAIWYYNKYNSYLYPFNCFIIVVINHTLKYVIARKRPLTSNCGNKLIPLKKMHHDPAMPSGDTAQSAVAAATMIYHGYSLYWLSLIPASAFARVYFGSHYIGDTIVGGLMGFIITWGINSFQ
eukprot:524670_1